METLSAMSHHRFRDGVTGSGGCGGFPSPIKRVSAKRTLIMSESDHNSSGDHISSGDEEMLEQNVRPSGGRILFDSPDSEEPNARWVPTSKPNINVIFCDEEDKNGRMTPPQCNSTPINPRTHSSFLCRMKYPLAENMPSTPKSFKYSLLHSSTHSQNSRDSSKVLISNIFSPAGMCLESAKKQYELQRQRQMWSLDNVDIRSPTTTNRTSTSDGGDSSSEDHHPVFDMKAINASSIDHSRYTVEFLEQELLGSGTFGEVYKCLNYLDGVTYAVKRTKGYVINTIQEKIFRKEIHAHASLAHVPHIVNYFSSWVDHGILYLQLEYCNGGSLERLIEEKVTFSEVALKRLLFQVCKGLKCMHEMDMIHMDIKPANILIIKPQELVSKPINTEEIHYKIGDFGHVVANNDLEVEEGDCRYLPKELLNNNFNNLSKVDIFSLGLTLYEASGITPLPKNGPLWHHIREGNLEKLPNISDDFYNLIRLMIDQDPIRRPSAQHILDMRTISDCDDNCLCSTRRHVPMFNRDIDFKSDFMKQYIDEHTVPVPNYIPH